MDRAKLLVVVLLLAASLAAGATAAPSATADALGDAVDNTALTFATFGDAPWAPITTDSVSGGDCAESGVVPLGGISFLQTTVTGPGLLSFWWKTAGALGDTLTFSIDGTPLWEAPSPMGWQHTTGVAVGPGAHEVTWLAVHGSPVGAGLSRIDLVEFNTQPTLSWTGATGYASDGLEPDIGAPSATFVYRVKYTDVDGGAPVAGAPLLHIRDAGAEIAGSPFVMTLISGVPATGAIYGYAKTGLLAKHAYTYYFEAADAGGLPASGAPTGSTGGPVVDNLPTLTVTGQTGYTADGVDPDAGTPSAGFTYRIKYTDVDGDAPAAGFPKLTVYKGSGDEFLPGSPFTMSYVSGSYASGAIYEYSLGALEAHGGYAYRFDVQNSVGAAAGWPLEAGTLARGPIVNTPPTLAWEGGPGYTADGVEPNTDDVSGTFFFRVKFADADYDPPDQVETGGDDVWLHVRKAGVPITGSPFQMQFSHIDGYGASYYTYAKSGLAAGYDYTYMFEATDRPHDSEGDEGAPATGPPTSWTGGPGVDPNAFPTLTWTGETGYIGAGCAPAAAPPGTTFDYRVTYTDGDAEAPAAGSPKVHILKGGAAIVGSPFTMSYVSGTPVAGSIYHYATSALVAGADYTYRFEAQDARGAPAGGVATSATSGPIVDGAAPTTTATGLRPDATSGWRKTSQSVSMSAVDSGGAGVAWTKYTVGGGGDMVYGGAFLVSGDGSHEVTYWSADAAGNVEPTKTGFVNIDATAPVTSATGLQPDSTSGWRNSSQFVTLAADDGSGSGVDLLLYQVDDGELLKYQGEFQVAGAGSHAVVYWATDNAGNEEPAGTGYVNIDVLAPTSSAAGLAASPGTGWVTGSTTLVLDGMDEGGAGVALLEYRIDEDKWREYTEPAELAAAEGSHTVDYRATDGAENVEQYHRGYLNVDATPPLTTSKGLQPDVSSGWRATSQSVALEAEDTGGSGGVVTRYGVDGGGFKIYENAFDISGEGNHEIVYYSQDAAGNSEAVRTGYVNIDATAPTTKDDAPGGWQRESVTVALDARDPDGSGVARTEYSKDGGATWQTGTAVLFPTWRRGGGSGVHELLYRSVDAVGNTEETTRREIMIDARAPVAFDDGDDLWHAASFTLHLTSTDALSGVTSIVYTIDGGDQQLVAGSSAELALRTWRRGGNSGVHWVTYVARDAAGNASYPAYQAVALDARSPQTTDDAPESVQSGGVTVHLSATDPLSGVAETWYELDGGSWKPYGPAGIAVPAVDGVHWIRYYSVDGVGNTEYVRCAGVTVDLP
jgi:hypothetical protein